MRDTIATKKRFFLSWTLWISICAVFLLIWDQKEKENILIKQGPLIERVGLTGVQRTLLFDYPHALQLLSGILEKNHIRTEQELNALPWKEKKWFVGDCPLFWTGVFPNKWYQKGCSIQSLPLFEKMQEGQIWRLFSPALLHANFWHLLFNLGWLWILGWRIEVVFGRWRYICLVGILAAFSNTLQYLAGGPFFLGLSGVVAGFVGFIWSCQKKHGWVLFSVPRITLLLLIAFIAGVAILDVVYTGISYIFSTGHMFPIANTAHIAGFLMGWFLGKLPLSIPSLEEHS